MSLTTVDVYTDGGCAPNPGPGGWAAILRSSEHGARKEVSGYAEDSTNNRMELTAAIEALKALKRPCRVNVHTDSQYLRKAFTDGWLQQWQANGWRTRGKKPVQNQDLWMELLALTALHEVSWFWVKGHGSDVDNNRCDELVNLAREAGQRAARGH